MATFPATVAVVAGVTGQDETVVGCLLWLESNATVSLFRGVGVVSLLSDVLCLMCCGGGGSRGVVVVLVGVELEEGEATLILAGPSLEARAGTSFFLLDFF